MKDNIKDLKESRLKDIFEICNVEKFDYEKIIKENNSEYFKENKEEQLTQIDSKNSIEKLILLPEIVFEFTIVRNEKAQIPEKNENIEAGKKKTKKPLKNKKTEIKEEVFPKEIKTIDLEPTHLEPV